VQGRDEPVWARLVLLHVLCAVWSASEPLRLVVSFEDLVHQAERGRPTAAQGPVLLRVSFCIGERVRIWIVLLRELVVRSVVLVLQPGMELSRPGADDKGAGQLRQAHDHRHNILTALIRVRRTDAGV
jgi:hypothetical protein